MESKAGFDLNTTIDWVTRVLKDPNGAAAAYHAGHPPWQQTFVQITLPLYVASAIIGFVLSWIFSRAYLFGAEANAPGWFLASVVWFVAYVFVVTFIFDFFAGKFGGKRDYDASFAALSLALIPSFVGAIVSPFPLIGWLIGLVASIYGLVLLYRFIPIFMGVPQDQRPVHFIVSLIVAFVVNLIVVSILFLAFAPAFDDMAGDVSGGDVTSGMFSDFERQADFADQAARDTYDPPADGRLTEAQVTEYVRVLQRTSELRERLGAKYEALGEGEQEPSIGDIFSGVKDMVRAGNAEMEVVKTGGGNWAEHMWVKNQLETARVQQDGTPAIEHNYALFLEHKEEIEKYE